MVKPSDPNLDQEIPTDSALSYKMCLMVFGTVINSSDGSGKRDLLATDIRHCALAMVFESSAPNTH
jgi:hypothetical protein